MGVIVEKFADERGLVWPAAVAPAHAHLVRLGDDAAVTKAADKLYAELQEAGVEVLYDDRDASPGAKFADADLIGCPVRLTISPRTLKENSAELQMRSSDKSKLVPIADVVKAATHNH
jgi:prolyl-tRNA synthetase